LAMKHTTPDLFPIGLEVYELSRDMRRHFQTRARTDGYTHEQWRALWHLERNEGITQAGLADILDIQPISLTRTLDRMAAAGLIERRPDPNDRRALKLFLTPEAEPVLNTLRKAFDELRVRATQGMSEKQQSEMVALLRHMRANLDRDDSTVNTPAKKAAQG
jgi:MarR family transcriptional regulator for hemolysin